MSLHPLGISRSRDVPNDQKQEDGSPAVRWRSDGDLACAFIDSPHGALQPMHHAAALEDIHRRACVLPMQFGAELGDEKAIGEMLQNRRGEILERLVRIDGSCEMGVRIYLPSVAADSSSQASKGDRKHKHPDLQKGREQILVQQLIERLQGLYRDWRRLSSQSSNTIRLVFLVPRDRVASFKSRATAALKTSEQQRTMVLGPWPPYNFA